MIKALAATLAPFDKAEKPQVSPRLDVSFIKKRQCAGRLPVVCGARCAARGIRKTAARAAVMPISIGFLRGCGAAHAQPRRTQTDVRRTCTRSDKTAHIDSKADAAIPICCDRHNFATGDLRGLGAERAGLDGQRVAGQRGPQQSSGNMEGATEPAACRRVGQALALFPHLHRSLN
jgi:hypothetical protein